MDESGSDLGQVLNMEVEGIKIVLKMSKGALDLAGRLGLFLLNSLKNAQYVKRIGATNINNLKARANGQALIPYLLDPETLKKFQKKAKEYGILYHVTESLRHAPNAGAVHILFAESDMASVRELMNKIKDDYIRDNVKKGMSYEDAEKDFETKNSQETMQEFAQNVGIMTPPETFDADMREKFGEDYAKKYEQMESPMEEGKESDKIKNQDFLDTLAKELEASSRVQDKDKENTVEFPFEYDEKNKKSHIVETTDTHIKVLLSENGKACVWLPKDSVIPPLDQENVEEGMRTAVLKEEDMLLVQDIDSQEIPYKIPAKDLVADTKEAEEKARITITKHLIQEENEQAMKTRIPGTWGENVKYLWVDKANAKDIHDGKTILTFLEKDKDYKMYSEDNTVVGTIKGRDLYDGHYDKVDLDKATQPPSKKNFPEASGKKLSTKDKTIIEKPMKRGG